jgi:hypothetical protein
MATTLPPGSSATARELLRNTVAGVKTATEAKTLLRGLQDRGYGTVSEDDHHRVTFTLA